MPKLREQQIKTVSSTAVKTLKSIRFFDIPNWIPIPKAMVRRMRRQFQAGEDQVETQLIQDHHLNVQDISFNNVAGKLISSPTTNVHNGVIFDVHGGGFIMGTARERNALLAAAETNLPVYSVDYTPSPEATAPTILNEVLAFYCGLLDQIGKTTLYAMGSSAGATIVTSILLQAHERGLRLPNALVLFAPALDISGNGDSAVFNNRRDLMSAHLALRLAQNYIGSADPLSPMISPLYGNIGDWFPATFMGTGSRDIMLSNVLRFADKLTAAHVSFKSVIKEGMWHGFTWDEKLPEAIDTRQQAWQFIQNYQTTNV